MPLYLDNNATTALDPAVLDAMMPYLQGIFGNPSSVHRYGRLTRDALEQARCQVARLVGAQPGQVIFTSGGTEANNLAIKGPLSHLPAAGLTVSAVEHASLIEAAQSLANNNGWQIEMIAVDESGNISQADFIAALHENTRLASVMLANNETGVLQDVKSLCHMSREKGILFHTDASQAAGKIPVDFADLGVQLMTLSSHKLYGPQGVGALIADRSVELSPIIQGGGQERGLRSGTENIAAIVGFGVAAELALQQLEQRRLRLQKLLKDLESALAEMPGITLFATGADRLPNTLQFSVAGYDGEALLMQLDKMGVAVSSGSACHSSQTEPSHVLLAMGVSETLARSAIRVSFGKDNKAEDVSLFIDALTSILDKRVIERE